MAHLVQNLDVLNELDTGDLILCNGNGVFSDFVKITTKSKWTHVGIVLRDPDFLLLLPPQKGLFLYNSDGKYEVDIEAHKKIFGVQINELIHMVDNYDGEVYARKLNTKLTREEMDEKFKTIYNTEYHKPYDWLPQDLIATFAERHGCKVADFVVDPRRVDRIFCSALVGFCYTQMGLLKPSTEWGTMYPDDFSKLETLFDGSTLGSIIPIKAQEVKENV